MKYSEADGVRFSQIMLGTVQLGMDYGLGDHTAKPSEEYAFSVLDSACRSGINFLDTANNYGDSERVIGKWLRSTEPDKRPFIVTKIGPFDHSTPRKLRNDILRQTKKSLETLGVETIDILMVHSVEDYEKDPETVKKVFDDLKKKGTIRMSGLSAYSENDYRTIASSGFDAVQIPLNVFDWSRIDDGGIRAMADAGMKIFIRSVFLQGLVFFTPETVDPRMDFALPCLEKYVGFCKKFGLSAPALAVSFVLSLPGITSVVLGCQTVEQVEENCALLESTRKLTEEEMEELHEAFRDIDKRVINPRLWFNHF